MKKIGISMLVLGLMFSVNGTLLAKDLNVAIVKMEKVFNSYEKTKEEDIKLKAEKEAKEKEGQSKIDEIKKLQDEALLLSDTAKQEKEQVIAQKMKELEAFGNKSKYELMRKSELLRGNIIDEIKAVVELESKDKKYDIVLDAAAVLYNVDGLDISDIVIEKMNANLKKESK